jgi:hypothetical protein
MRKTSPLALHRQTVKQLDAALMRGVVGGDEQFPPTAPLSKGRGDCTEPVDPSKGENCSKECSQYCGISPANKPLP